MANKPKTTGTDLLIKSIKQVAFILLTANVLVLLTEVGVLGPVGWRYACIVLLALGVFCLRIFGAIAWAVRGTSEPIAETATVTNGSRPNGHCNR